MEVIKQIGVFDEKYNVYFDETDYNTRARKSGWRVSVVPEAKVYHEESATMNTMISKKAILLLSNLMRYELKHASIFHLFVFMPYYFLIHIPQFIVRGLWYAIKIGKVSKRDRRL